MIVFASQNSVKASADKRTPKIQEADWPKLRATSDIAYGAWAIHPDTRVNQGTIRHLFSWFIHDPFILGTVRRIMENAGKTIDKDLGTWSGFGVSVNSDSGKALLGMSVGSAIG